MDSPHDASPGLVFSGSDRSPLASGDPRTSEGCVRRLVDSLVERLRRVGVQRCFGVSGGAIGRFNHAAWIGGLEVVHTRHEAGAAFMACEVSIATGRPAAVFTTTGPGWTNAITGLVAAASEGAQVVCLVGGTARASLGRGAFQETSLDTLELEHLLGPATPCAVLEVRDACDLPRVDRVLDAVGGPGGSLTVMLLPSDRQARRTRGPAASPRPRDDRRQTSSPVYDEACRRLNEHPFFIWAGFGARRYASELRRFAEHTGAAVLTTPRAKGVFPETHPQWLGATGMGGTWTGERKGEGAPSLGLVLGTRLGQFSSFFDPRLVPRRGFVHVDVDPSAPGRAYPDAPTLAVEADIGEFLEVALRGCIARPSAALPARVPSPPPPSTPRGLHPLAVMQALQRWVVEDSALPILSEAGNSFAWTTYALRFDQPRYRVSTRFGAMGHFTTGVVGAALAREGGALAVVGDGAMLMNNEISTAVRHGARAVWLVLNDASYGMVHHGMRAIGLEPYGSEIPRTDFVAFARCQGADGVTVSEPEQLGPALLRALESRGGFVIDVHIDPSVRPPFGLRNEELLEVLP